MPCGKNLKQRHFHVQLFILFFAEASFLYSNRSHLLNHYGEKRKYSCIVFHICIYGDTFDCFTTISEERKGKRALFTAIKDGSPRSDISQFFHFFLTFCHSVCLLLFSSIEYDDGENGTTWAMRHVICTYKQIQTNY